MQNYIPRCQMCEKKSTKSFMLPLGSDPRDMYACAAHDEAVEEHVERLWRLKYDNHEYEPGEI